MLGKYSLSSLLKNICVTTRPPSTTFPTLIQKDKMVILLYLIPPAKERKTHAPRTNTFIITHKYANFPRLPLTPYSLLTHSPIFLNKPFIKC